VKNKIFIHYVLFFIVQQKFFHPLAASPLQHGTAGACGLAPMEYNYPTVFYQGG